MSNCYLHFRFFPAEIPSNSKNKSTQNFFKKKSFFNNNAKINPKELIYVNITSECSNIWFPKEYFKLLRVQKKREILTKTFADFCDKFRGKNFHEFKIKFVFA